MKWSAIYLPYTEGWNPTRHGFRKRRTAKKYVSKFICQMCRKEVKMGRNNDSEDCATSVWDSPCAFEWMIVPTGNYHSLGEILDAAGAVKIFDSGDKDESCKIA